MLAIGAAIAWLRPRTNGRVWLTALTVLLFSATVFPIDNWVGRPLENRFVPPTKVPERIDGLIVLGGFVQTHIGSDRGVLAIGGNAERIMAAVDLAADNPESRLIITGFEENQAPLLDWIQSMGLSSDRIEFETRSRNTFENAKFTYRKVNPKPEEVWLLITSARHMPRAMGVFRKLDWPVLPYPVDYRTTNSLTDVSRPDVARSLVRIGKATKEWVGLIAYYLLDRTDELFPAPNNM